jgi:amino acid adenylation domain-containing protein
LEGRPDPERLRRALLDVQASQASLRCAVLADQDHLWLEEQAAPVELELPWVQAGAAAEAQAWAQGWQDRPFDPARAPLWRCALLPLPAGRALLAFCFHHLIFDQRSLEAFYAGLQAAWDRPSEALPAHPPATRQLAPAQLQAGRAYWAAQLRGSRAAGWLRPAAPASGSPALLVLELGAQALAALRRASAAQRCTLFAAAAAAWAESLAALDGATEACFVSPFTLRDQPLSDQQVGYWVHPLPLRLTVDPAQGPAQRLRAAGEAVRGAMAHRDLSLSQALRAAQAPLPEAYLVLQGELTPPPQWLGLAGATRALKAAGAKAALALTISGEQAWRLELEHDPSRLEAGVAQRALDGFVAALGRLAADVAPAAAQGLLLQGEPLEPSEHASVLQAFHQRAHLQPQAPALLWQGGQWDYATLAARSMAVARALDDRGVTVGDRVGVFSPAGPAWAAAMLGCFELSAVYVPLDPAYPAERLRCMVEDAHCKVVLGMGARPDSFPAACWLPLEEALLARPPWAHPVGRPSGADAAYVIFTSGSSGRPKGVQVGHGALLQHARGYAKRLGLGAQDRVLQFVSISFDPSLEELLPALVAGAALALPQRQGAPSAQDLAAWVQAWGVTVLHLPAAYWHAFMASGGAPALAGCPSVRAVVTGGEAPDPRWVKALGACLAPGAMFMNAYGPTEACISALSWEQPCCDGDGASPLPLGRPLPGVRAVVVGSDGQALGPGSTGELWLGGEGLAQGYLGPHGLRQDGFTEAAPQGGAPRRWYRSGDRVAVDGAGGLHYRGRMDRQVKAAGIRLDLEELEQLLRSAPGVANAVVDAQGSGDGLTLSAWVQPLPGDGATEAQLRAWLGRHVPAAAVPQQWAFCQALPLTANGKLDRAALQAPPALARVPAPDPVEEALCLAFATALNLPAVGPQEDFFSLGGSSLRAVRLAAEASQRLGRELRIELLYQHSTPHRLAAAMQGRAVADDAGGPVLRPLAGQAGVDLLLLPPVSGRLDCYGELAQRLGEGARVWGLDLLRLPLERLQDWDGLVEAAAQAVAASLEGRDLVLAGWSMGGLLAVDLARALPRLGVRVRRLGLLDSVLPDPLMAALVQQDPAAMDELVSRDLPGGADEASRQRYRLHARLLGQFRARGIAVPVTLAISQRTADEQPRHGLLAWALLAGKGMSTLLLPGDHFSMMQGPGLGRLAARLLADAAGDPAAATMEGRGHAPELR